MNINDFKRKIQEKQAEITKAIHRTLPIKIGRKAADHFQDNFRKGGYVNNGLHPWPQTQRQKAGGDHAYSQYGPLLSARNYLYGSIRYVPGDATVTVGTSVPYAAVHNQGATITTHPTVTTKMRKFAWRQFFSAKEKQGNHAIKIVVNKVVPNRSQNKRQDNIIIIVLIYGILCNVTLSRFPIITSIMTTVALYFA